MSLQKTIYKTFFTLMGIVALSAYGFPAIVRGYGSSDTSDQNVLGASTGSDSSNYLVWYIIGGIVILGILAYIIYLLAKRRQK